MRTNELTPEYIIPAPINTANLPRIQSTADLPHGGNWWCVQLDDPCEVNDLQEWLLRDRELFLMKSQVIDAWYLFTPVKGER